MFDFVASRMMTVRPKMTMLPPICVNAWASQSSRNGRLRKTSSAPPSSSSPVSPFGAAVASSGWDVTGRRGPTAAVDRGVTALHELDDAAFEGGPLDQHVAVAGRAAEADVGAQPVDEPGVAAAGVASLEPDHVAQQQREHGMA